MKHPATSSGMAMVAGIAERKVKSGETRVRWKMMVWSSGVSMPGMVSGTELWTVSPSTSPS